MRKRSLSWLTWLGAALVLLAILAILLLDVGGWGTFALDIAKSVAVQAIVALVLLGIALAILTGVGDASDFAPPRFVWRAVFVLAPVVALPALPIVFKRPIDLYDGAQTLVLVLIFYQMAQQYPAGLRRPALRRSSLRPRVPIFRPPSTSARPAARVQDQLYQNLLHKVMGDHETAERLIEYERRRAPGASREELLQRAIYRWERDNR